MACVTMKRPVEVLGSPHMMEHQPLAKRKRCGPLLFPTTPSPSRGIKRAKRKLEMDDHYASARNDRASPSPFLHSAPPLKTGKLVAQVEQELKRIQKRRLFHDDSSASPSAQPQSSRAISLSSSSSSPTGSSLSGHVGTGLAPSPFLTHHHHNAGVGSNKSDQPLFTLKQVTTVCQRLLKEREEEIKEEYDKVLVGKLAEQYDAFVKFSHDQVERRLTESAFSYVS